jgi:hypothetical protein
LKQVFVKVRNIVKDDIGQKTLLYGNETVETYSAYKLTSDKFELLFQCDEDGNQVFGENGQPNPNLVAQHQETAKYKTPRSVAAPVVNSGQSPVIGDPVPEAHAQAAPAERKKPGPKPKLQTQEA